jgi:hypothetical protein
LLSIGDLWQNGRLVASPDYEAETFEKLRIEPTTTNFVKAGLAIDEKFLIPLNIHPWHKLHTQAYCVAVECEDDRRLLIPCTEIIRFYFGSSGNLIQRLFTAPLTTKTLWSSKSFDPAKHHMHLLLAAGLSGASASDIARIAGSRFAWRSAAGIHASCQKAAASGLPVYPYTGFPFEGNTDLVASGVWLPFGEEHKATFLACRLRSCSHPFPFRSLSYETTNRKPRIKPPSKNDNREQTTDLRKSLKSAGAKVIDSDPDTNKRQRTRNFSAQHRFPDLVRKQVWKEDIGDLQNPDVFLLRSDGSIEQVAFGEPGGSSDATGIDVTQGVDSETEVSQRTPLPRFVRTALATVRRSQGAEGATVKIIYPPGKSSPVFFLPIIIDENGMIEPRLLFSDETGRTRQRRGCFVEASHSQQYYKYIIAVEGGSSVQSPIILDVKEAKVEAMMQKILDTVRR